MTLTEKLKKIMLEPPLPFHPAAVRFWRDRPNLRGIIGDDMGIGKTYEAIACIKIKPELRPCVVVCPATIKLNWKREIKRFAGLSSIVLDGMKPSVKRLRKSDIWIVNWDIAHRWQSAIIKAGVKLVVADEFQMARSDTAIRTVAWRALCADPKTALIALSGTPIVNRPVDFFPVLNLIAPKVFPSFNDYGFEFCGPTLGFKGLEWQFKGATNLKKLRKLIKPLMIRRLKKDVLADLPPELETVIPIHISNRKEYKQADNDFIAWVRKVKGRANAHATIASQRRSKANELKKLAADGKLKGFIEWVKQWMADDKGKLVVFAWHKSIVKALLDAFPDAVFISGAVQSHKRQAVVDKFQKDKHTRLFVGNIVASGTGVTLTAASTIAFIELSWVPSHMRQARERVNRIGQKAKNVNIIYFIAENTIEESVMRVLERKQKVIDEVIDGKGEGGTDISVQETVIDQYLKRANKKDRVKGRSRAK